MYDYNPIKLFRKYLDVSLGFTISQSNFSFINQMASKRSIEVFKNT